VRSWTDHLPSGISADALALGSAGSLTAAWEQRWSEDPAQHVLVDTTGAVRRADELDERSAVAARRFAAAGVQRGDRVAISAATSFEFVVTYVGILRLGAIALPMNTAYREPEVAHIARDAAISAAVIDDASRAAWISAAAPQAVVTGPALDELPPPAETSLPALGGDDPALLVYTSGTTGTPKGALLSHGNLLVSSEAVALTWRWTPADRLVLTLPLFHLHGLGVGLHGTLVTGATAVLHPGFDPAAVFDAISAGGTMFFGVPTMWHRLADAPGNDALRRLRLGVSGSAPLPAELHAAIARIAGAPPIERYGLTETVMLTSNPYDGERRGGSVGFPFPFVELRLAPDGEIEAKAPNVFGGYWQRPEANAESFVDGWFRTGDLGAEDDDGYLRIVGRKKELIITGGFNVYPREVEEAIAMHPAIAEAAVVGAPDREWGERVCAFLVLADDVSDAELDAWCADRLAPYKRPRRYERVAALPRNALGKVLRGELARALENSVEH
jgi:malonyl-CoA/methylmalonyl-CoA synthetase